MLKTLGQGLAAVPIVYGLILAPVPYQDPLQATEGQLRQLRPAGDVDHADLINHYPAGGVLPPADGLVGEVVNGRPTHLMGCQVRLGQHRHPFAFVTQELDKLSCEVRLACPRRPSDEHTLSSRHCFLSVYLPPGVGADWALCLCDGKFALAV